MTLMAPQLLTLLLICELSGVVDLLAADTLKTVLIQDIDNPFDHDGGGAAHVSLKPISDLEEKLRGYAEEVGTAPTPSNPGNPAPV